MSEHEKIVAKLLGIDLEAEIQKRKEEYRNYVHLLLTLTDEQFCTEIVKHFAIDVNQAAILTAMHMKAMKIVDTP